MASAVDLERQARLPEKGRNQEDILRELRAIAAHEDARWETGQISGSYYHAGKEHFAFLNQVYGLFSHVNILQRDMCPSGTKFEAEIVAMTARMLHGDAVKAPDEVVGTVTSGGSESIMLPMLAYREQARAAGIAAPEVVAPATAHPAFDKGAWLFGVKLVRVPVGADLLADVDAMRAEINANTVALVGSAGNYPYGLIDPLERLSRLAVEHGIGMHVDGCYGGFMLPWLERLGYAIPPFDFRLPGVTSMSCDTHKWGYGPKGASVVLYRNRALRRRQYFTVSNWAGGLYAAPTLAGSRSEGISAATWAAMVSLGEEGYLEIARQIMASRGCHQGGRRRDSRDSPRRRPDVLHRISVGHGGYLPCQRLSDRQGVAHERTAIASRLPLLHHASANRARLGGQVPGGVKGSGGVCQDARLRSRRKAARFMAGGWLMCRRP